MVMAHAFQIEPPGAPLDRHLPHQTCLYQVSQIVVRRSPRGAWIQAIHSIEDFRSRRMSLVIIQECHHRIALRGAAQSAALQ